MIACGEAPGGSTSATSTLGPVGQFFQKLLTPLAFGAADVDLITGTETSPNITQSETFTTANPDNPNQIVVAYNDSRGRNASSHQYLRRIGLHRRRHHLHPPHHGQRSKPLRQYLWRPCCSVQQANRHLVHCLARRALRRSGPRRLQVHHSMGSR